MLEFEIVGAVDFAKPRCIGRTPCILQQPGVKQVSFGLPIDAKLISYAEGNEGGAS